MTRAKVHAEVLRLTRSAAAADAVADEVERLTSLLSMDEAIHTGVQEEARALAQFDEALRQAGNSIGRLRRLHPEPVQGLASLGALEAGLAGLQANAALARETWAVPLGWVRRKQTKAGYRLVALAVRGALERADPRGRTHRQVTGTVLGVLGLTDAEAATALRSWKKPGVQ